MNLHLHWLSFLCTFLSLVPSISNYFSSFSCPPSPYISPMILHFLHSIFLTFSHLFSSFPVNSLTFTDFCLMHPFSPLPSLHLHSSQSCSSWWSTTCTGSSREQTSAPQRAACRTAPARTLFLQERSSHMTMRPLQRPLRNCAAKWRVCVESVKRKDFISMLKELQLNM